jgi:hypothetical protein
MKRSYHLKELSIDERKLPKRIFKKWGLRVWARFI